ncbi:hypothetical protein N7501_002594 [Penicillium viridicatum]|nr:hypothetical protein N7501_002594 [Penicillium viridicatum]
MQHTLITQRNLTNHRPEREAYDLLETAIDLQAEIDAQRMISVKGQSVGLHPGTRLTALTRALAIPLGFTSPE